jgi:hypothetical protein
MIQISPPYGVNQLKVSRRAEKYGLSLHNSVFYHCTRYFIYYQLSLEFLLPLADFGAL